MAWQTAILRLQKIDLELTQIAQRMESLGAKLDDQSEPEKAWAAHEARITAATQARKTQQNLEFELGKVEVKLQHTEHQLYDGRITNPRELRDLQSESQALQRRKGQLEDELLEAMMAREEADEAQKAAKVHAEQVQDQWDSEHQSRLEEQQQLERHRQDLQEESAQIRQHIPETVLDSYDYLMPRTGGMPVSQLRGDICSVCGMNVFSATRSKVQRGEEAYCDGCRRIIVA